MSWEYWRDEEGIIAAARNHYALWVERDPVLKHAMQSLEAAETTIDYRMQELDDINTYKVSERQTVKARSVSTPAMREALIGMLRRYRELINSGDCDDWDDEVIAALNALGED